MRKSSGLSWRTCSSSLSSLKSFPAAHSSEWRTHKWRTGICWEGFSERLQEKQKTLNLCRRSRNTRADVKTLSVLHISFLRSFTADVVVNNKWDSAGVNKHHRIKPAFTWEDVKLFCGVYSPLTTINECLRCSRMKVKSQIRRRTDRENYSFTRCPQSNMKPLSCEQTNNVTRWWREKMFFWRSHEILVFWLISFFTL